MVATRRDFALKYPLTCGFVCGQKKYDMVIPGQVDLSKPSDTYLHSYRVANDVFIFATYIGLPDQIARNLRWAVLLHDIGKLDVPSEILNKPGKLSEDEFAEMKNHTRYGAARIKNCGIDHPIVKLAAEIALYHHAPPFRWCGQSVSARIELRQQSAGTRYTTRPG